MLELTFFVLEPGVYFGKIDVTPSSLASGNVATDTVLIPYSAERSGRISTRDKPLGMVLTEFHVLILFEDHMKAICVLNEETIMEDIFAETFGPLKAIVKDPAKGTVWVYSEYAVYRYKIVAESRNIWDIHLKKQNFEMARTFSKSDPVKYDKVLRAEAEYHFANKE